MGDTIYCLDYLTGVERWRHDTYTSGRATIVMEPDHILCAKGGYIQSFTVDGRLLWTQPLKGYGVGRCSLGYPGNVVQSDDVGRE